MTQRERYCFLSGCACFALLAMLDAWWLARAALPCPRGDDAFYKSPAAELAQHGRLTQPSTEGYLPHTDEVFAAYPPVYQLAVAAWFQCFGFSVVSAVAFGHCIHLLDTFAVMAVVALTLAPLTLSTPQRLFVVCAPGVLYFGILRFFDRQEELAVLCCWIDLIFYLSGRMPGMRGAVVTGLLVGICGTISPWSGLVFAAVVTFRVALDVLRTDELPWPRLLVRFVVRLLPTTLVALLPVAGWLCWLAVAHPNVFIDQFLAHIRVITKTTSMDVVRSLLYSPYQLPALLVTVMLFPRLLSTAARASTPPALIALFSAAVFGLIFACGWRGNSYNYIWLCLLLLIPCFGYLAGRLLAEAHGAERYLLALIVLLCSAMSFRDPLSLSLLAHDLPAEERPDFVYERLKTKIPAEDLVAVTSRHWYAFQGRNPWRDAMTRDWAEENQRYRTWKWVVIPLEYGDEDLRRQLTKGCELVDELPSTCESFAPSFSLSERTWAYQLYRRQETSPPP